MTQQTVHSEDHRPEDYRPAANQYSLRGMFLFMTATCVILAVLALVIKSPVHWLGVLIVPLYSFVIIAAIELAGRMSPPRLNEPYSHPPAPKNALQTAYFSDGGNLLGIPTTTGESSLRLAIKHGMYGKIDATAESKSELQDPAGK